MRSGLTVIKVYILLLYLLTNTLLWLGFAFYIVPTYGSLGVEWTPNILKIFETLLVIGFFSWYLPSKLTRPSDFFVHVQFLFPIIPMMAIYGSSDLPRAYMCFVLLSFTVMCHLRKIKIQKIRLAQIPTRLMMLSLLILAGIYILSIIMRGGLAYLNFNFLKVYEFRSLAEQNLPRIFGYFSPWVSKVLLPIVLLLSVYRRKWIIAGLSLSGSVMMFALTNHKAPIFYPFLLLGIYFFLRSRQPILSMITGNAVFILASIAAFFLGGAGKIVAALTLFRTYFIPAQTNFYYYDFFSTHPHTFFAENKFTFDMIPYPYPLDSTHLIGQHYLYKNAAVAANTGWLGSGYMQMGLTGMLIYAVILGLLLSLVDTIATKRDPFMSTAMLFIPFITVFVSSDLPASLLTHGLLLALFLSWICRLEGQALLKSGKSKLGFFYSHYHWKPEHRLTKN